jgi:hypothetical protein
VIILMQQAVQNGHGFFAAFGFLNLTAGSNQVFVAVGYIASAGIAH